MFEWHKKEKPFLGIAGFGGGVASKLVRRGGAAVSEGPFTISGGVVLTPGNGQRYHIFEAPGNLIFTPGPGCNGIINAFILAGGGSGGNSGDSYAGSAGGGGGGAVLITNFQSYGDANVPISYPVTVGTGAPSNTTDNTAGSQGLNSNIDFSVYADGPEIANILIQAQGGGYGATSSPSSAGGPGGNGGGGNSPNTGGDLQAPPNSPVYPLAPGTVTVYGNAGHSDTSIYGSGGGGSGLGGVGERPSADGTNHGGDGGAGRAFPDYSAPIISPAIPAAYRSAFTNAVGPTGLYGGGGGGANYLSLIHI